MSLLTAMGWEGRHMVWLVLGVLGASLGIGSMPSLTIRQCWTALAAGAVFATLAPQALDWGFIQWTSFNPAGRSLPSWATGFAAFFFGVGGRFIVPMCIAFWTDPKGAIEALVNIVRTVRTGSKGGEG